MKNTKKILSVLVILAVMMFTAVGTLAYFSTYSQVSAEQTLNLMPKAEFTEGESKTDKDIVIKNTGDTDIIVRAKLSWSFFDEEGNPLDRHVSIEPGEGWVRTDDGKIAGYAVYEFDKALRSGAETTVLKVSSAKLVPMATSEDENADSAEAAEEYEVSVIWEYTQAIYSKSGSISPYAWDTDLTITQTVAAAEEVTE